MNQLVAKTVPISFLFTLKMMMKRVRYQKIVPKTYNVKIKITKKLTPKVLIDLLPQELMQILSSNMRVPIISIPMKGEKMKQLQILCGIGSQISKDTAVTFKTIFQYTRNYQKLHSGMVLSLIIQARLTIHIKEYNIMWKRHCNKEQQHLSTQSRKPPSSI